MELGVWDMYQEKPKWEVLNLIGWNQIEIAWRSAPYVLRFIKEVSKLPGCFFYLTGYLLSLSAYSAIPALKLWYSSHMLKSVGS